MSNTSGVGGTRPPTEEQQHLADLSATFLADEVEIRVAVLDAVDNGASIEEVAEATGLPVNLIERWTGQPHASDPERSLHEGTARVVDEVTEQRQLRTGSPAQRVAAKSAKRRRRP